MAAVKTMMKLARLGKKKRHLSNAGNAERQKLALSVELYISYVVRAAPVRIQSATWRDLLVERQLQKIVIWVTIYGVIITSEDCYRSHHQSQHLMVSDMT